MLDLHLHSYYSDGTNSPKELIELAHKKGLEIISVTDHDGISGVLESIEEGKKVGIKVVPGIEISVASYPRDLHILGYGIDIQNLGFLKFIEKLKEFRDSRNQNFIEEFSKMGIDFTKDDIKKYSPKDFLGKPNFAFLLKSRGYVESLEEAFTSEKFFRGENFQKIKKEKPSDQEGIREILAAGGVPVLAHPGKLKGLTNQELDHLVKRLKSYGLMGIECYYRGHSEEFTRDILNIARENNLIVTAGSDFHGHNFTSKGRSEIGVEDTYLEEVEKLDLPF